MIEIIAANKHDMPTIKKLAEHSWSPAFESILSAQQIAYMMEMMYSNESLEQQMDEGHHYAIARKNNENVGYMSCEINHNQSDKTKIHKLYILPEHQRHGIGKALIDYATQQALKANNNALFLNVNKYNDKAINFYRKHHFFLAKEEVIDIGNGFVMDDYVFELTLSKG